MIEELNKLTMEQLTRLIEEGYTFTIEDGSITDCGLE